MAAGRQDGAVDPRLPSLLDRPVAFGRASAERPDGNDPGHDGTDAGRSGSEHPLDVVVRGATGVATGAWLTADGVPALSSSGRTGGRWRRRRLDRVAAADLPDAVPTLAHYYRAGGSAQPLSLDIGDERAFEAVLAEARDVGTEADLWLCHPDVATLTSWRPRTSARLVNDVARSTLDGSLERRAAELEQRGIDGLRLFHRDWSGGKTTLVHRFGRLALGTGVIHDREVAALLDAGIDAVYSDRIEPMVALLTEFYGTG